MANGLSWGPVRGIAELRALARPFMPAPKRARIEPTEDWSQLQLRLPRRPRTGSAGLSGGSGDGLGAQSRSRSTAPCALSPGTRCLHGRAAARAGGLATGLSPRQRGANLYGSEKAGGPSQARRCSRRQSTRSPAERSPSLRPASSMASAVGRGALSTPVVGLRAGQGAPSYRLHAKDWVEPGGWWGRRPRY